MEFWGLNFFLIYENPEKMQNEVIRLKIKIELN